MLTIRSLTVPSVFSFVCIVLLTGCPKKLDLTLPEAGMIVIDASSPTPTTDTSADAAPALTTSATTVAAPHGCAAGQAAFLVDGKTTCETECNITKGSNNQCTQPMVCIGVAPLAHAEAGALPGEYCRTAPSGACTAANMAQFWNNNAGGRPTCEVLCKSPDDTSCPTGLTCKGNAMLFLVNGKQGQLHRFCKK